MKAYTYDLNGNRTMTGYQTSTGNQLTNDGTWTYTYDAEGNLTKKSKGASAETWYYGYDNLNHLTSAKQESTDGGTLLMQATYVYDARGDRLEKDVWTQSAGLTTVTRFAYADGNVWADLNGSNQFQMRRLYLGAVDSVFARIDGSGTAAWYLPDRLGSVRDLVDANGTAQDHINYDGFGVVTSESNSSFGDRYKWTGREFDSESALLYNRARYYQASVGRWSSQDPIGFQGGDTNLYRYVHNSPTNFVDPRGLTTAEILLIPAPVWTLIIAAGGAITALAGTAAVVVTFKVALVVGVFAAYGYAGYVVGQQYVAPWAERGTYWFYRNFIADYSQPNPIVGRLMMVAMAAGPAAGSLEWATRQKQYWQEEMAAAGRDPHDDGTRWAKAIQEFWKWLKKEHELGGEPPPIIYPD